MASAFYNDYRNNLLGNGVHGVTDLDADDIRVILYDEGADALNLADQDLADILAGAREAVSGALTGKTIGTGADGVFDHADETITSVTGTTVESLTYYEHVATESIAPLLVNIDNWTGLPLTPNGGDVILQPIAPASGGAWQILGA